MALCSFFKAYQDAYNTLQTGIHYQAKSAK